MEKYQTLLYYKYTKLEDAEVLAKRQLKFCKRLGLTGRVLVADEGMNGSVSGTPEQCKAYMEYIEAEERFKGIEWKIDEVDELSFNKMHVRYRKELVGFNDKEQELDPNELTGQYLEPDEFMEMLESEDVIILDTRNKVEWELGKFKNAITLDIDYFREFPEKLEELKKYADKKILAYCTGGIRCEKATAYMLKNGFKDVFQLHGGIIRYGKVTGGKDFEGQCYVFDKRIGVPVNDVNPSVISVCKTCGESNERMVNCANAVCNDHFIQCESCSEKLEGCCSEACQQVEYKRQYDGTGYYAKKTND